MTISPTFITTIAWTYTFTEPPNYVPHGQISLITFDCIPYIPRYPSYKFCILRLPIQIPFPRIYLHDGKFINAYLMCVCVRERVCM